MRGRTDKDKNKHYVLIKDFNKFMYNQTKHKERKHFCMYCLQCFSSERVLNNHKDICIQVNGEQAIKMPDKDNNILKFNNFHKQQPVPFVIYADFEAITEKIHGCQQNNESGTNRDVIKAEVMVTNSLTQHSLPLATVENLGPLFKTIFP